MFEELGPVFPQEKARQKMPNTDIEEKAFYRFYKREG